MLHIHRDFFCSLELYINAILLVLLRDEILEKLQIYSINIFFSTGTQQWK